MTQNASYFSFWMGWGVLGQTNSFRFAGLLRTFAMAPKGPVLKSVRLLCRRDWAAIRLVLLDSEKTSIAQEQTI